MKWAALTKKGPYLIDKIWKCQNNKSDVIFNARVKQDVLITNPKNEVSSVIDRNIFTSIDLKDPSL
jgi:hypothetical protein